MNTDTCQPEMIAPREVTNEELEDMFRDLQFAASKRRGSNELACDVTHMTGDERLEWFNEVVLPLWEWVGCPEVGRPGYLGFALAIFGITLEAE